MTTPAPPERMKEWARLIAMREAGEGVALPFHRAISSLRIGLETLVGANGADAMVYRAIFLARRELGLVVEAQSGERRLRESLTNQDGAAGAVFTEKVMAYLLWLVVEFIGEDLTISFLQQTWPNLDIARSETGPEKSET
jgi:hypothetical protein